MASLAAPTLSRVCFQGSIEIGLGQGNFDFSRCALLTGKSREVQANLREP
jgi:hypothetical protein